MNLKKLVNNIKRKNKNYDCLIPVSGGKDSTWQVIVAKKIWLETFMCYLEIPWKK